MSSIIYRKFYNIYDMENIFIERLQEILISRGLTQKAFADLIGVKQSQVSEWLKGKAKPGYDSLRAICIALNLSGNYILGLSEYD